MINKMRCKAVWLCVWALGVIVLLAGARVAIAFDNPEYKPHGSAEIQDFEKLLYNRLGVFVGGVWWSPERLKSAVPAAHLHQKDIAIIRAAVGDAVQVKYLPKNADPSAWLGVYGYINAETRAPIPYIIGKFETDDKDVGIEIQSTSYWVSLTFVAPGIVKGDLKDVTKAQAIDLLSRYLKIPHDQKGIITRDKMEVVAGTPIYWGYFTVDFDPGKSPRPAHWWNYIPFWISHDRIYVGFTTPAARTEDAIHTPPWEFDD